MCTMTPPHPLIVMTPHVPATTGDGPPTFPPPPPHPPPHPFTPLASPPPFTPSPLPPSATARSVCVRSRSCSSVVCWILRRRTHSACLWPPHRYATATTMRRKTYWGTHTAWRCCRSAARPGNGGGRGGMPVMQVNSQRCGGPRCCNRGGGGHVMIWEVWRGLLGVRARSGGWGAGLGQEAGGVLGGRGRPGGWWGVG